MDWKQRLFVWVVPRAIRLVSAISVGTLYAKSYWNHQSDVLVRAWKNAARCEDCRSWAGTGHPFLCDHHMFALRLLVEEGEWAYEEYMEYHRDDALRNATTMFGLASELRRRESP